MRIRSQADFRQKPRLEITRKGLVAGFLSIFLFLAANNSGNNTLHLLGSIIIALLFSDLFVAYLNIKDLTVSWDEPPSCFAGETLNLTAQVVEPVQRPRYHLLFGQEFLPDLGIGQTFCFKFRLATKIRGEIAIPPQSLSGGFPLGFFQFKISTGNISAMVYPAIRQAHFPGSSSGFAPLRESQNESQGDYWMHRVYEPGEDARQIHWVLSARTDEEFVVSRAAPRKHPLRVWIDFQSASDEHFELFLEYLTGFFVTAHHSETLIWCWFSELNPEGCWAPLKDHQVLKQCLTFLGRVTHDYRPPPPPLGDEELHCIRFVDFDQK